MSDIRQKSFTGPSRRPALHRSSSESNFMKNSDASLSQSQDSNSSPDISIEEKIGDAAHSVDYIPESCGLFNEKIRKIREGSQEAYTSKNANVIPERQYYDDERDDSDNSSNLTASVADDGDNNDGSHYKSKSHDFGDNIKKRTEENRVNNVPDSVKSNFHSYMMYSLLVIIIAIFGKFATSEAPKTLDFHTIKENFPTQSEELWLSFESGVNDVITRTKPSTFIFLYEEEAEELLTNLTENLSKYAVCNIRDCSKEPIKLTDTELNSPEVVRNFGSLVDKYRNELEERGVMIINNLQNVIGTSAQVFHTFCDEFTPLVEKSLFIFTMKVDHLPENSKRMQFVEEYFKNKWTDVKIDTLNALITRITSMVLEVHM